MKSAFGSSRIPRFRSSDDASEREANHWKLLIRTTSLLKVPRVSANWPPSGDHLKSKISPDSKFVICSAVRLLASVARCWRPHSWLIRIQGRPLRVPNGGHWRLAARRTDTRGYRHRKELLSVDLA